MRKWIFVKIISIIWFVLISSAVLAEADISDVNVDFCNTDISDSLDFAIKAWGDNNVCLQFSNLSNKKVPVSFGFVDWLLTNDSLQKKACSNQWDKIAKYIDFDKYKIDLSPWEVVQLTGNLKFPLGFSWEIHACLAYTIPIDLSKTKKTTATFDVIVRKASFMDWYVVGDFVRDLQFLESEKSHYVDLFDNSLVFVLPFVNLGSLSEELMITGVLINNLWYERTSLIKITIPYGSSKDVKMSFSDIPFYNGKYSLKLDMISSLSSSLDLSYIPQKEIKPIKSSYNIIVFLFPWKILFSVLWILLILFILRKIISLLRR